ncbi:hypothetical protein COO03_05070 [Bacillus sp. AFS098217]|uniref:hypothetical protein n=1 Tax=Bacillus sp. AFS098217 TaxID=2033868 RepID=UPI000BEE03A7|nr:hypothetical protein [Bacillus sp. AFS098217]PEB54614.1 hypothetical protein COO03_05070 [Bacillus sp. AFS098217]
MKVTREMLHQMLEKTPDEQLPKIFDLFQSILDGDEYITAAEKVEAREAKHRIQNGEFVTLEDLTKDSEQN